MAPPLTDKLLITGIGRSGTKYMATVLTAAGIECGHEKVYNGHTYSPGQWTRPAESSWFASAFDVPERTLVVHIVRHPLHWLASWSDRIWPRGVRKSATVDWINWATGRDWYPLFAKDRVDAAMELYLEWFERARERADMRLRVEDVDPLALRTLGQAIDVYVSRQRTIAAVREVSRRTNTLMPRPLTWDACRRLPHALEFSELAEELGYGVF